MDSVILSTDSWRDLLEQFHNVDHEEIKSMITARDYLIQRDVDWMIGIMNRTVDQQNENIRKAFSTCGDLWKDIVSTRDRLPDLMALTNGWPNMTDVVRTNAKLTARSYGEAACAVNTATKHTFIKRAMETKREQRCAYVNTLCKVHSHRRLLRTVLWEERGCSSAAEGDIIEGIINARLPLPSV